MTAEQQDVQTESIALRQSSNQVPAVVPSPSAPTALEPHPIVAPSVSAFKPTGIGNIAAAVSAVMSEIGSVAKRGKNSFHNYEYARMQDVLEALTPLIAKNGLMIVQTESGRSMFDDGRAISVEYKFTIAHKSGEVWPEQPIQTGLSMCRTSKGTFDDKALNKCHTAARKYFLMALFQIPTEDQDDADRGDNEGPQRRTIPSPASQASEGAQAAPKPTPQVSGPYMIDPRAEALNFETWTDRYIGFIQKAASIEELGQWDKLNDENLNRVNGGRKHLYDRIVEATQKRQDELTAARKAPPATAARVPSPAATPAPTPQPAADPDPMPDPAKEPDAAHKWIGAKLAAFTDYIAAETWWNDVVAPQEKKFFPPDWGDLLSLYRKMENKFN